MPPASATAAASAGGEAPAIGAIRTGNFSPKRSAKARARSSGRVMRGSVGLGAAARSLRPGRAAGASA
jgi:hypothetical protein